MCTVFLKSHCFFFLVHFRCSWLGLPCLPTALLPWAAWLDSVAGVGSGCKVDGGRDATCFEAEVTAAVLFPVQGN
jgi:hypothetical protein